jgi:hypothetical protein
MEDFSGYKWIKVSHFKFNSDKSWEENFLELEKHHIEETTFLINKIRSMANNQLNKEQAADDITDLLTTYGFITEYPVNYDGLKKDIIDILIKNSITPPPVIRPDKNVKVPEYVRSSEGYDPDKLNAK